MKRRLKWIALALAALGIVVLIAVGIVAWRATRVPAWYAQALDCPQWPADMVEKESLIPMRNWIARTSAGDLDAKPADEKQYSITLTEAQINALLAKWTDNLHGDVEMFRAHLHGNTISIVGQWSSQGRPVGMDLELVASGDPSPCLKTKSLFVGQQPLPRAWVLATPIRKAREYVRGLLAADDHVAIDAHDIATKHTAKLFFARAALSLLMGDPVGPNALVSPQLSLDDAVALRITGLRIEEDRLIIEFRMLGASEREQWAQVLGNKDVVGK